MSAKHFGRKYYDDFHELEYTELKRVNQRAFYNYIYDNEYSSLSGIYLINAEKVHSFTRIPLPEIDLYLHHPALINDSFVYESATGLIFFKKHLRNSSKIPGNPLKFAKAIVNERQKYRSENLWDELLKVHTDTLLEFSEKYFTSTEGKTKKDTEKKEKYCNEGKKLITKFVGLEQPNPVIKNPSSEQLENSLSPFHGISY